jgi:putative zinc finger protein/fervidolysin-like protein
VSTACCSADNSATAPFCGLRTQHRRAESGSVTHAGASQRIARRSIVGVLAVVTRSCAASDRGVVYDSEEYRKRRVAPARASPLGGTGLRGRNSAGRNRLTRSMDNHDDKTVAASGGRVLQIDPAAHKVADVLLPWLVNGTLEGDERAFVEQHLAACPRCQREAEWLRDFHAACGAGESSEEASAAFRSLKRKLDARPDVRLADRLRSWISDSGWTRWVIAAEFAMIAVLGAALFAGVGEPSIYRTLGAGPSTSMTTGALVVVFDPATPEGDLRRILRDVDARVVDGPTQANAYVLEVQQSRREQALRELKSNPAVVLVQNLDSKGSR